MSTEIPSWERLVEQVRRKQKEENLRRISEKPNKIILGESIYPIIKEKIKNQFETKALDPSSLFPNLCPVLIKYNPCFITPKFNAFPQVSITIGIRTRITADNVAEFAYPLAQFVEQVRPDYIIACDRGARIVGLAVHMLYGRLYGALPTQDHSINFRKISKNVPADVLRKALRPDIERMLATVEFPTVLVLDDLVATGSTKSLVYELFTKLSGGRVNVLYGVLEGGNADVTGSKNSVDSIEWMDKVNLIGVDYVLSDVKPSKVDSQAALDYRRRMSTGIDKFVSELVPQIASVR